MENKYQQISVQKLATSTVDNRYLLQCNGLYYETSYSVAELVLMLQKYSEEKECISSFVRQKKGRYTTEQIENVIEQYIHPILIKNRGEKKNKTFLYERELFPISLIDKFSDAFRLLFKKQYMITVMLIGFLVDIFFMITTENLLQFSSHVNVYSILGLLVFMLGLQQEIQIDHRHGLQGIFKLRTIKACPDGSAHLRQFHHGYCSGIWLQRQQLFQGSVQKSIRKVSSGISEKS